MTTEQRQDLGGDDPTCPQEAARASFLFGMRATSATTVVSSTDQAAHHLLLRFADNPFDHLPMIERGLAEWLRSSDAVIAGKRAAAQPLMSLFASGFQSGYLSLLLITLSSITRPAGFDIISQRDGYLEGNLLWVAPEWRGRGLIPIYFDALLELARHRKLEGFRFLSTLPRWQREAYHLQSRHIMTQRDGSAVFAYWRRV